MLTNSFSTTSLYLEVRPASLDGLVLVNYQLGGVDFIAIAMRDGIVELWYDLGQGPVTITSRTPVSLEEWHSILVSRSGRLGELMVDDTPAVSGTSPGSFTMLQVNSDLYVGGAPMPVSLPVELRSLSWFNGCIREIRTQVQGSTLDLIADAISGQGVSECPALDVCDVTTCSNNGICTNTVDSFVCECVPGFTGSRCEVDLCIVSSPCLNNGICYAEDGDVLLCNCSAPFTGPTCTERKYQSPPPPTPPTTFPHSDEMCYLSAGTSLAEAFVTSPGYLQFGTETIGVPISRSLASNQATIPAGPGTRPFLTKPHPVSIFKKGVGWGGGGVVRAQNPPLYSHHDVHIFRLSFTTAVTMTIRIATPTSLDGLLFYMGTLVSRQ